MHILIYLSWVQIEIVRMIEEVGGKLSLKFFHQFFFNRFDIFITDSSLPFFS